MGCGVCSPRTVELLKGSVQKVMCDHTVQSTLVLLRGGGSTRKKGGEMAESACKLDARLGLVSQKGIAKRP